MSERGSTRTLVLLSAAMVIFSVVVAWALDLHGRRARVYGAAGPLGAPEAGTLLIKTPLDAYRLWKERGYRGRIILYVGERWARLDPSEYNIPPVYRPYPLPLYNLPREREREFLDDGNFLFMVALNGIARRIDAVLAPSGFAGISAQARQARNVSMEKGHVFHTHNGFPRNFYTAATFRPPAEPVLLYVGASHFKEEDPESLARTLTSAGLRSDLVVLCAEENDPSIPPKAREALLRFADLVALKPARER